MNRINHILKLNTKGLAIWQIEDILKKGAEVTVRTVRRCLAQMTERFMIGRKKHPSHKRAFLYFLKPVEQQQASEPVEPDQSCCTTESQQTPKPVEQQQTSVLIEISEEQIDALDNVHLPEIPPDKIQVGDRVIVLVGHTPDREGTVEKVDFHRCGFHVYCTVRLDNTCTTDEPLFNLRWTKDRQH